MVKRKAAQLWDTQTDRHPTVIIRACDVGRTSGDEEGCAAVAAGFSDCRVLTVGWTMHTPDT